MRRKSPAQRWAASHGFRPGGRHPMNIRRKARGGKRSYRWYWRARFACWMTQRTDKALRPYACQWGPRHESGEVYPRHWHIGHMPADDWWGY